MIMYKQLKQQVISTLRATVNNIKYPKRILVVRQSDHQSTYNNYFLYWVSQNVPEASPLFELHYLPCEINNWDRYALFIPWLQDPLKERFPHIYQDAKPIEEQCQKHNIPVINTLDQLSNSIKSVAAKKIASVGIRTAKTVPITDVEEFKKTLAGLSFPFFIREDWIHGCQIFFVQTLDDLANIPFDKFIAPIAVEFIEYQGRRWLIS